MTETSTIETQTVRVHIPYCDSPTGESRVVETLLRLGRVNGVGEVDPRQLRG